MGNLYTHIIRHQDSKINILSKLKALWRSSPRNFVKIKRLQQQLIQLENRKENKAQKKKLTELQRLGTIAYYKQKRLKEKLKAEGESTGKA